jgi:hypothetical protein
MSVTLMPTYLELCENHVECNFLKDQSRIKKFSFQSSFAIKTLTLDK